MFRTPIDILEESLKEIAKQGNGFELGIWLATEVNTILPNGNEEAKIELAKFLRASRRKDVQKSADEFIKAIRILKTQGK